MPWATDPNIVENRTDVPYDWLLSRYELHSIDSVLRNTVSRTSDLNFRRYVIELLDDRFVYLRGSRIPLQAISACPNVETRAAFSVQAFGQAQNRFVYVHLWVDHDLVSRHLVLQLQYGVISAGFVYQCRLASCIFSSSQSIQISWTGLNAAKRYCWCQSSYATSQALQRIIYIGAAWFRIGILLY